MAPQFYQGAQPIRLPRRPHDSQHNNKNVTLSSIRTLYAHAERHGVIAVNYIMQVILK
jgi:hypothetical protein